MAEPRKVAIIGGSRIPFARSFTNYMGVSNQDLMTAALKGLVDKYNLQGKELGDVALGTLIKPPQEWNFARECSLGSGLSPATPAFDVVQACGTGLEAAIVIANKIALGQIDVGIAGGVDSNSDLPITFPKKFAQRLLKLSRSRSFGQTLSTALSGFSFSELKPQAPGVEEPRTGKSMGQHCELMAQEWNISREDQDELAYTSHQRAAKAYERGFYDDMVVPFGGLEKDNNLRPDTTLEKMAKLKPAFERSEKGTLTAANSTALTDGASAVLMASEEYAKANILPVLAYMTFMQTAAVDFVGGDGLLMAPAWAVPKLLDQAGISLQDFDLYEIHEAFAAQVLCTLKAWESDEFCKTRLGRDKALGSIDREKLNVNGGSVALGHPFAATGGRIVAGLAKALNERGGGRGLISICTGGGMGVTAILEK